MPAPDDNAASKLAATDHPSSQPISPPSDAVLAEGCAPLVVKVAPGKVWNIAVAGHCPVAPKV